MSTITVDVTALEDSTFVAGLLHDRMVGPLMLDSAINGDAFLAYVEQSSRPGRWPDARYRGTGRRSRAAAYRGNGARHWFASAKGCA
jgi:hypothetical protein